MSQFIGMLKRGDYRQNRKIGYYADELCVTPKYLSEVSKKVSGPPANYWITRYTSLNISRLLRNHSHSFTDIADMFASPCSPLSAAMCRTTSEQSRQISGNNSLQPEPAQERGVLPI